MNPSGLQNSLSQMGQQQDPYASYYESMFNPFFGSPYNGPQRRVMGGQGLKQKLSQMSAPYTGGMEQGGY